VYPPVIDLALTVNVFFGGPHRSITKDGYRSDLSRKLTYLSSMISWGLIPAVRISDSFFGFLINSESIPSIDWEVLMGEAIKIMRLDMSAKDLRCAAK
jgi:hypothetical protein